MRIEDNGANEELDNNVVEASISGSAVGHPGGELDDEVVEHEDEVVAISAAGSTLDSQCWFPVMVPSAGRDSLWIGSTCLWIGPTCRSLLWIDSSFPFSRESRLHPADEGVSCTVRPCGCLDASSDELGLRFRTSG